MTQKQAKQRKWRETQQYNNMHQQNDEKVRNREEHLPPKHHTQRDVLFTERQLSFMDAAVSMIRQLFHNLPFKTI